MPSKLYGVKATIIVFLFVIVIIIEVNEVIEVISLSLFNSVLVFKLIN